MNKTDEAALEAFRRYGTSAVSDALDTLGSGGTGLPGVARVSGTAAVAGPAFTVRFTPVEPGEPGPAGEFVDEIPPGAVALIVNDPTVACTIWGDLLATTAQRNGVAGTVIDGFCRDVGAIRALDYPLWSRGAYMKSGKQRVRQVAMQEPVEACGTLVTPGDIVVADDSGCLVVPAALVGKVADEVLRIEAMEQRIRADLAAGMELRVSRRRNGYNTTGLVAPATA